MVVLSENSIIGIEMMADEGLTIGSVLLGVGTFALGVLSRTLAPTLAVKAQRSLVRFLARNRIGLNLFGRLNGQWSHAWYANGSKRWNDENLSSARMSAIGRHAAGLYYSGSKH